MFISFIVLKYNIIMLLKLNFLLLKTVLKWSFVWAGWRLWLERLQDLWSALHRPSRWRDLWSSYFCFLLYILQSYTILSNRYSVQIITRSSMRKAIESNPNFHCTEILSYSLISSF